MSSCGCRKTLVKVDSMGEPRLIESVADLVRVVSEWGCESLEPETAAHGIWYRGQADKKNDLVPGVERHFFMERASKRWPHLSDQDRQLRAERSLNKQFMRLGASFFGEQNDMVRIYFLAQHYDLPTRLLDWTTNPLAALFFACQKSEFDGRLFVIHYGQIDRTNPRPRLPDAERGGRHGSDVTATVEYLFGDTEVRPENPGIIPILPALRFPRMMRQGSCFTLHMPGAKKLVFDEESVPVGSGILSYEIPAGDKGSILAQLRCLGVGWSSLFAHLEYLAREVKESF
jgi:hypothetical protein